MTGFFSKIFGSGKKSSNDMVIEVEDLLSGIFEKGDFNLKYDVQYSEATGDKNAEMKIELDGDDMDLLTEKEGILLESFQLLIKRMLQHKFSDQEVDLILDCNGFREDSNKALVELAERLKGVALEKGRSVYIRALPPKDRKVIHQYLATDARIRSRSIGDGLFKKIKIYPVKEEGTSEAKLPRENV